MAILIPRFAKSKAASLPIPKFKKSVNKTWRTCLLLSQDTDCSVTEH